MQIVVYPYQKLKYNDKLLLMESAYMSRMNLTITELDHIADYERVIHFEQKSLHIAGIIAIHNTTNGAALGGCRLYNYPNFDAGLDNVLSLAKAMTYKNTIMDLPYGGGKAVIFQNDLIDKKSLFKVFARLLNILEGQYITTDDVGTSVDDMYYLRQYTKFAKGIHSNGKQIPATAYGVYQAIRATLQFYENKDSLTGVKVFVQGLGKVGYTLCEFLKNEKCQLYLYDIDTELTKEAANHFDGTIIDLNTIDELKVDVFCPCALRNSVNENTLSKINMAYIIGGENNPIASTQSYNMMLEKNIIYIPDYLSNAGGVIDIACEDKNYCEHTVFKHVNAIYTKTMTLLQSAKQTNKTPLHIANRYVEERYFQPAHL